MNLKTIFSIAAFFAAFTLSVVLFGAENTDLELNNQPEVYSFESDNSMIDSDYSSVESGLQIEMRRFLDEDKRNGFIFYGEVTGKEDDLAAQTRPTAKLVKKMQKMNCSNLPNDFCADWNSHVKAWKNLSLMLDHVSQKNADSDEINDDYSDANDQINDTYENLLNTAQDYDVDFQ